MIKSDWGVIKSDEPWWKSSWTVKKRPRNSVEWVMERANWEQKLFLCLMLEIHRAFLTKNKQTFRHPNKQKFWHRKRHALITNQRTEVPSALGARSEPLSADWFSSNVFLDFASSAYHLLTCFCIWVLSGTFRISPSKFFRITWPEAKSGCLTQ